MRITEQQSNYLELDKMSTSDLLININREDSTVALAVERSIPQIEQLVEQIVVRMKKGGRLFYLGAGTSGRLGVLDASEIPPTYGAPYDLVIGLIAGGDGAIRKAVENAEDDTEQGWYDMQQYGVSADDIVVGIAASGSTPYVVGACRKAKSMGILTSCITCNPNSVIANVVDIPIVVVVGPEFVTGSTRMKSGTAQKLVLNMVSTATMIRLGHVKGNKMVDMQLTNAKLVDRGTVMIMDETDISDYQYAKSLLQEKGSVRNAVDFYKSNKGDF